PTNKTEHEPPPTRPQPGHGRRRALGENPHTTPPAIRDQSALRRTQRRQPVHPAAHSLRAYTVHEVGDRLADLAGAVFLDKMAPLHRHFGLVRPGAANSPLPADQDRAWVCINKELRNIGLGKPGRIVFHHLHHIRGLALDRNHPWPCKRRPAVLAQSSEGLTVSGHFLLTELAYDGARQHSFNEHVLFKNHLLAAFGSETLKHTSCILRPVGPS